MKSKRSGKIVGELHALNFETAELISEVADDAPLIMGSMSRVMRTCGKSNCRCSEKPCHECDILMTSVRGGRKCQVIRRSDVPQVAEKVRRYRRFREVLKRLQSIDKRKYSLLKGIMKSRSEVYK
ncbi:MAG: DUF6788 family protein [bacterium]